MKAPFVDAPGWGGLWVVAALLVAVHFFLHVGLEYGRVAPDLLTLALLLMARELGLGRAAALGFGFGLLEDALSVLAFGANAVAMTLVGIGAAVTRDFFVGDSRLFIVSYLLIGKWARDLIHWVAVDQGMRQPFVEQVVIDGGIAGVYVAVVGLVVTALTVPREEA